MIVLGVLLVSWVVLRVAGSLWVGPWRTWRDAGRSALAITLIFTASAHFTAMRYDLAKMVPGWVPAPMTVIYLTGVLEVVGAIGILLEPTRRLAGIALCLLLVAMFPANVKAAQEGLTIGGNPATSLWLRAPMQVLLIWLAWWSTRPAR